MSAQSSATRDKKDYKRDLQAYAWCADRMPDKKATGRKYKRRDRQRGKKAARG
jgi:hypothetical protein